MEVITTVGARPLASPPDAYLLIARDDGFSDVAPLSRSLRTVVGREATNPIVIKDDQASRYHAEFFFRDGSWYVHDKGSLNGTRLNGTHITDERAIIPQDEILIGKTRLLFVESMEQVPSWAAKPRAKGDERVSARKKAADLKLLNGTHEMPALPAAAAVPVNRRVEQELARLYRLALAMGAAPDRGALAKLVVDAAMEATAAEAGAVLTVRDNRELDLVAHRVRGGDTAPASYYKVSRFVSNEVMAKREAVLAENVAARADLASRDSVAGLKAASLICAPAVYGEQLLALVHLYSSRAETPLGEGDLEFATALAAQLGTALHNLAAREALAGENQQLRDQLGIESELVGGSSGIREIEAQIGRVARTTATVLVRGESGVGKELVARAIHRNSPRRDKPFVTLNCAALTETLLESELFGHEKGSFTGATEKMVGKFEAADGGTIFLDEIGEMAAGTQAKFLRVLEGHPFERVGGHTPIRADVRVVAATNRALEDAVRAGTFRRDLFFRLQVVEMRVPPLRDRPGDVAMLAQHFLSRFIRETGRKLRGYTAAALSKLQSHRWPGNVRELRNVVERAVALGEGPMIDAADIWLTSLGLDEPAGGEGRYEPVSLDEMERRHIAKTLDHTDWNKSQAATILGIERSTLDRKIKSYDIRR